MGCRLRVLINGSRMRERVTIAALRVPSEVPLRHHMLQEKSPHPNAEQVDSQTRLTSGRA